MPTAPRAGCPTPWSRPPSASPATSSMSRVAPRHRLALQDPGPHQGVSELDRGRRRRDETGADGGREGAGRGAARPEDRQRGEDLRRIAGRPDGRHQESIPCRGGEVGDPAREGLLEAQRQRRGVVVAGRAVAPRSWSSVSARGLPRASRRIRFSSTAPSAAACGRRIASAVPSSTPRTASSGKPASLKEPGWSGRVAPTTQSRAERPRCATKVRIWCDWGSSHCTSSTMTTTGRSERSGASRAKAAWAIRNRSGLDP